MKTIINNLIGLGVLVWVIAIGFIMMVISYIGCLPLYLIEHLLKNNSPSKIWKINDKLNKISNWLDNQIAARR